MGRVSGKRVLVTASGQGIGRASCLMLAREGALVTATDIDETLLDKLKEEADKENLCITVKKLDVTNKKEIENISSQLDKVDILFNCAG